MSLILTPSIYHRFSSKLGPKPRKNAGETKKLDWFTPYLEKTKGSSSSLIHFSHPWFLFPQQLASFPTQKQVRNQEEAAGVNPREADPWVLTCLDVAKGSKTASPIWFSGGTIGGRKKKKWG
jgi:hypothetical protein